MYTKELGSYSTKTADSEETKELGSKKNIKIFPPNYQLFIKAAKKLLYKEAKSIFLLSACYAWILKEWGQNRTYFDQILV